MKMTILTTTDLNEIEDTECPLVIEGLALVKNDDLEEEPEEWASRIKIYPRKKRITLFKEFVRLQDIPTEEWFCYDVTDIQLIERPIASPWAKWTL
jgi:hypothetical protein